MPFKICMIEDDSDLAAAVREHLVKYEQIPQLILLDINIPYYDGFYWCNEIRRITKVPIIFMSARIEDTDQVRAIMSGGDDYVIKPFNPMELFARVNALLRRVDSKNNNKTIKSGNLELNMETCEVFRSGKIIELRVYLWRLFL